VCCSVSLRVVAFLCMSLRSDLSIGSRAYFTFFCLLAVLCLSIHFDRAQFSEDRQNAGFERPFSSTFNSINFSYKCFLKRISFFMKFHFFSEIYG